MREMKKYIMITLLIVLLLSGCSPSNNAIEEDIFQYKDSYVGDNSAVGGIVGLLPNNEHFQGFELKTKEEPYGIILEYGDIDATTVDDAIKEVVIYNSAFLFALVKNVDWITYNFAGEDQTHTVTREELNNLLGKRIGDFTNEEDLRASIQESLEMK